MKTAAAVLWQVGTPWSVEEIESDDDGEELPAVQSDALSRTAAGTSSPATSA